MKRLAGLAVVPLLLLAIAPTAHAGFIANKPIIYFINDENDLAKVEQDTQTCQASGNVMVTLDQGVDQNGQDFESLECVTPTQASGCQTFDPASGQCTACNSGYTVQNGQCTPTSANPGGGSGSTQCAAGQFKSFSDGGSQPMCVSQCPSGQIGDLSGGFCFTGNSCPSGDTCTGISNPSSGGTVGIVNSAPPTAAASNAGLLGGTGDTGLSCTGGTCTYVPLEPLPGLPASYGTGDTAYSYVNGLILLLIIVGAMLAVARFSIGGIIFMTSEIAGNRAKAKSQMWACVWGLLLLISSVLILKTVNPDLVRFNLSDLQKLATGSGYFQVAPTQGQ